MHYETELNTSHFGVKDQGRGGGVKDQGRGGITNAGKSILWTESYTRQIAIELRDSIVLLSCES